MAAQFSFDVDAVGQGTYTVNGTDIAPLPPGTDIQIRPGQPTTVSIHHLAGLKIEGEGIIHIIRDATAAEVQAELVDLLAGLLDGAGDLWQAAMQRPEAAGPGGPAAAFLLTVIDAVTP